MKARWMKLPKWARFCLYYGTMPIWMPPAFILGVLFLIVALPFIVAIEAWKDFK